MVDGRPWIAQDIKAMLNDTLTWTVMLNDTAVRENAQCSTGQLDRPESIPTYCPVL